MVFDQLNEEQIAKLESEHGPVYACETKRGWFYFRRAKRQERDRFIREAHEQKAVGIACDNLTRACVVWPDKATLAQVLDESVSLSVPIAGAINAQAEGDETARAKLL